ncbi:MAG: HupE/UreJ family protein [Gammaproteobacteria bacterium]
MSEAERQAIIDGGNLAYMQIGATHMLTGYDHLLFVFGIIFFLKTFVDIVKYVTAFTLGHSITLIFATFNAIQFDYFIIDAIVGLSVCYIAFANIDGFRKYLDIKPPNMMVMVFGFGLIHGFGLSSRLQELLVNQDGLLLNIISFNIGIELGQVTALGLMLLIIAIWRKTDSFRKASLVSNYILILAGAYLFLMQMHGYTHTSNPEEFAIASTPSATDTAAGNVTDPGETEWEDTISITIPARDGREYKFYLAQGASLEFAWQTEGTPLYYDFHGEPEGDTTGYFESFEEDTSSRASGSLTTTFAGTHGWYWQNNTSSPVEVILKASGDYRRLDQASGPSQEQVPAYINPEPRESL